MISLKQLQYALAVEKTLHFKKAAEMCFVSQSTLSTAISELESRLGLPIFERNNKQVFVTPQGQMILNIAREIQIRIDDLNNLAQSQKEPLSHPMSIGVIPTIGPYLLPKVLPLVRQEYPDFQLTLIEEQSQQLIEKLRNGDIDAAILALPFAHEGLHAFEFWQENFSVVAHRSNPLMQNESVKSNELDSCKLLLLKDGHCLKDHALAACKLQSTQVDMSMSGTSLNTLIQMAAGKMGTTLVPDMALDQLIGESSELKSVALSDPGPHRRIAFITRLNYTGINNIELLISLFRRQLEEK